MKALKALLLNNPDFLKKVRTKNRNIRHLIFSVRLDNDPIAFPVCSDIKNNIVSVHKTLGVTCIECLKRLIELSSMDYSDALLHVAAYAPKVLQPDETVLDDSHGGQPTKKAALHNVARDFLKAKMLDKASDLPKNIIGTFPETYYFNMIELLLIDESGEVLVETTTKLQQQIDALPIEKVT